MNDAPGTVLILGADGFIGRHLAFGLRAAGWRVLASARRPSRLARMGFDTLILVFWLLKRFALSLQHSDHVKRVQRIDVVRVSSSSRDPT